MGESLDRARSNARVCFSWKTTNLGEIRTQSWIVRWATVYLKKVTKLCNLAFKGFVKTKCYARTARQ